MLFKFTKKEPAFARGAVRDGDLVEVTKGKNIIQLGEFYVIEGGEKYIMSGNEFRNTYEPASSEAKLHLEDPSRRIIGSL